MRSLICLALCAWLSVLTAFEAHADKRVALVIGNGAYRNVPALTNPANDAADVAASLKQSGFDLILETNLDQLGMQDAIIRFAREARGADVALFYYSGHALQYAGVNYLVPVDALVRDEVDLRRMARADEILADLQQAKNLRILVLDACRDNPFAEDLKRAVGQSRSVNIGRGLAKMESPEGTIISYATQAGRTADDGDGRNSPYTTAFLKHIREQDNITTVFQTISAGVYQQTRGAQVPELSLSFFGEFYLNGKAEKAAVAAAPAADPCADAAEHWHGAEAVGTVAAFEDHVLRFPTCSFAGLAKSRVAALSPSSVVAKPTNPFDGIWVVKEVCENQLPTYPAANYQYVLNIKDGVLHTRFGEAGQPGSSAYDGKIAADGTARIAVEGLVDTVRDPLHRPAGTPYHYAFATVFKGSSGAGVRIESARHCRMELSRLEATDPSSAKAGESPDAESKPASKGSGARNAVTEPNQPETATRQTGNGLTCSGMRGRCATVCVANTGRADCASTVCVRMEQQCLNTGCWMGRGFSGCGLAKR